MPPEEKSSVTLHPNMNTEISIVQKRFLNLFTEQKACLAGKPNQSLNDLQHEAGELRNHEDFSVRVSAEINNAACALILQERGKA